MHIVIIFFSTFKHNYGEMFFFFTTELNVMVFQYNRLGNFPVDSSLDQAIIDIGNQCDSLLQQITPR